MSQRIKIQYTVTADELEGEVKRLLRAALVELKSTQDMFRDTNAIFSQQVLEDVDKIRGTMMNVDMRLEDVTTMVSGYLSLKHAPAPPAGEPSQKIKDLKDQLANFKDKFSADQDDEVSD